MNANMMITMQSEVEKNLTSLFDATTYEGLYQIVEQLEETYDYLTPDVRRASLVVADSLIDEATTNEDITEEQSAILNEKLVNI